jgi:hypothetical protein
MRSTHATTLLTATALVATTAFMTAAEPSREAYRTVTLPAGTVLSLRLDTPVGSDSSRVEDRVRATLRRDVVVGGLTVLDAGAPVTGYVTEATRPGRVKGRGRIGFRFTSLVQDGDRYDVRTSRVIREAPGTKKRDAATIAIPAGAGAVIGAVTKGKKGAAIGGAAGGAAGTGIVLATRGKDVRLGRGALVAVRLLEPVTLRTGL